MTQKRYIDMTAEERRHAFDTLAETRVLIEGCRNPSPQAVRYSIREEQFILRVARSRGDAWTENAY